MPFFSHPLAKIYSNISIRSASAILILYLTDNVFFKLIHSENSGENSTSIASKSSISVFDKTSRIISLSSS
jgi:high-affinity nickel permease